MRPELSIAHLDIEDRDLAYEKVQRKPITGHSRTPATGSGITLKSQLYLLIDQGAHQAMVLLEVPNRYLAGLARLL